VDGHNFGSDMNPTIDVDDDIDLSKNKHFFWDEDDTVVNGNSSLLNR
jgi:hypothetical protein